MMTKSIHVAVLSILMCFVVSIQTMDAQNSKRARKKVVVKKRAKRVSSNVVSYKRPKKKVVSVRALPNKIIIKHKGITHYYANNKFYTYSGGRYIVIAPKVGFRIKRLPLGYLKIKHRNYFWVKGVFYLQINNEYEVVEPELGTIIYELPKDYERVEIDGSTFYEFSNVLYEKVQVDGTRAYEVVGFIEQ